jgi:hypothetical protein
MRARKPRRIERLVTIVKRNCIAEVRREGTIRPLINISDHLSFNANASSPEEILHQRVRLMFRRNVVARNPYFFAERRRLAQQLVLVAVPIAPLGVVWSTASVGNHATLDRSKAGCIERQFFNNSNVGMKLPCAPKRPLFMCGEEVRRLDSGVPDNNDIEA